MSNITNFYFNFDMTDDSIIDRMRMFTYCSVMDTLKNRLLKNKSSFKNIHSLHCPNEIIYKHKRSILITFMVKIILMY